MRPITDFSDMQAAVNAETALYVPPGEHRVRPFVTRNRPLTLVGAGTQSRLVFEGDEEMLTFDGGQVNRDGPQLLLRDFAITTKRPARCAVSARWAGRGRTQHRAYDISGVTIQGEGMVEGGGSFFRQGLRLENGANGHLEAVRMEGDLAEDGVGVEIFTDEITHACEAVLDDVTVTHYGTAVKVGGWFEGLHLVNSTVLSCVTAALFGGEHVGRPGVYSTGNHFNFRTSGIYLQGAVQAFVTGNLFYAQFGDGRRPYCAINTGSAPAAFPLDGKITGNTFVKVDDLAPDGYAVVVAGGLARENYIIDANHFTNWRHGIVLQPGARGVRVGRMNEFTAVDHEVVNLGEGNILHRI